MTPRIGLLLLTALLMQCGNPVETPLPGAETIPPGSRKQPTSTEETPCSTLPG